MSVLSVGQHDSFAAAALVTLTSADGAGESTPSGGLGQAHQVMFGWLNTTLTR